jgi:hypothetical protein
VSESGKMAVCFEFLAHNPLFRSPRSASPHSMPVRNTTPAIHDSVGYLVSLRLQSSSHWAQWSCTKQRLSGRRKEMLGDGRSVSCLHVVRFIIVTVHGEKASDGIALAGRKDQLVALELIDLRNRWSSRRVPHPLSLTPKRPSQDIRPHYTDLTSVPTVTCGQLKPLKLSRTDCEYCS